MLGTCGSAPTPNQSAGPNTGNIHDAASQPIVACDGRRCVKILKLETALGAKATAAPAHNRPIEGRSLRHPAMRAAEASPTEPTMGVTARSQTRLAKTCVASKIREPIESERGGVTGAIGVGSTLTGVLIGARSRSAAAKIGGGATTGARVKDVFAICVPIRRLLPLKPVCSSLPRITSTVKKQRFITFF